MNDDIITDTAARTAAHSPTQHRPSAAGRLLESLASDGNVSLHRVAHDVGVRVEQLEACRRGDVRLSHALQMRLAAVALLHAPQLTRQARALYAQAQAALRLEAGEVTQHRTYPNGPFEALPHAHDRSIAAGDGARMTPEQSQVCDGLAAAARGLADEGASSGADAPATLHDAVTRAARVLRASGEPPEHALVLVKAAVESALTGPAGTRREVMESVVRSFVDAYYGA